MEALVTNSRKKSVVQIVDDIVDFFIDKLKVILCLTLTVMVFLIGYSVFSRYIFNLPVTFSEELLRYALIWFGLLGASICFQDDRHLSFPLLESRLSAPALKIIESFKSSLIVLFSSMLAIGGYNSMLENFYVHTPILGVSMGIIQSSVLISGVMIVFIQVLKTLRDADYKLSSLLYFIAFLALNILIMYGMDQLKYNEVIESIIFDNLSLMSGLVLFGSFFFFLILGVPIAIGLAISGILTLSLQIEFDYLLPTIGERLFSGLDSFSFLALPFFILSGNLMNQGGIAKRLLELAMVIGRRIPGTLWHSNVIANMLFGSISGSAIAAASAMGGIINPQARKCGYDINITTAVNAASSPCGMLIPPSTTFIVYSLLTGGAASITALFLAGYIPGLIMGASVTIVAYYFAKKLNYAEKDAVFTSMLNLKLGRAIWNAMPCLSLVVIIMGGIISGLFTAIEASGVAVIYCLILAFAYGNLSIKLFYNACLDTVYVSTSILFLIGCSSLMSWSMTFASIPDSIGTLLVEFGTNKVVFLLIMSVTLLVVGIFMDMAPAMLIFTPIFYPVAIQMGVDPVHFGVVMVYNLCIGILTPPVGTVLFVSCTISGANVLEVVKPLLPIFALQIAGLLLITFIPELVMFLPNLIL